MPESKTSQEIFNDIKKIYDETTRIGQELNIYKFRDKIESYFYENFLHIDNNAIELSVEQEEEFFKILENATYNLQKEQQQLTAIKAIKVVGRFLLDVSTLGIWRFFKSPTAKKQFEDLVDYSNKLVKQREKLEKEAKEKAKKEFDMLDSEKNKILLDDTPEFLSLDADIRIVAQSEYHRLVLDNNIKYITAKLAEIKENRKNQQKSNDELIHSIDNLKIRINKLNNDIVIANNELQTATAISLEKEENLNKIREQTDKMLKTKEVLMKELNAYEQELSQLKEGKSQLGQLQQQITLYQEYVQNVMNEYSSVSKKLLTLQNNIVQTKNDIERDQNEFNIQKPNLEVENNRLKELKEITTKYQEDLENHKEKVLIFVEKEKAVEYGKQLFSQYLASENEGKKIIVSSKEAIENKYSNHFKPQGVININQTQIKEYKNIALGTFNRLVAKRQARVLKASKSINKIDTKLKDIKQQITTQQKTRKTLDVSARGKFGKITSFRIKVNKYISELQKNIENKKPIDFLQSKHNEFIQNVNDYKIKLRVLEGDMHAIKTLHTRNKMLLKGLSEKQKEIDLLKKQQHELGETLISNDQYNNMKADISDISKAIKSEQKELQLQQEDLQSKIELQRINLAEIQSNNMILGDYQKKLDALSKKMDKDNNLKENFYNDLKETLINNIAPVKGWVYGNYEEQRNTAVDLIVQKYKEEFAKNPMITSEYLLQNGILNRIVTEVTDKTKNYLNQYMGGGFEKEIQDGAANMAKEFVDNIYQSLTQNFMNQVRNKQELKNQSVREFKQSLTTKLKIEIASSYPNKRNCAVDIFVDQYIQRLQKFGAFRNITEKLPTDVIEKSILNNIRIFINTNNTLDINKFKNHAAQALSNLTEKAAKNTIKKIQRKNLTWVDKLDLQKRSLKPKEHKRHRHQ